jgi:flagellar hook-associated protein 2
VSATSGTSSITSGTLGDAAPISFPGIASGIDYDEIIEKYTAETLSQEKPTQTQINNLSQQNTAILNITNLIGAVQDSLTALSNPALFGAYSATVSTAANGTPAATATQITGETPTAGTYEINAQTAATSTVVTNNQTANAQVSQTAFLNNAGLAITPSNGTSANGIITLNGVQSNYDVGVQTLPSIIAELNSSLQGSDGGSASFNAATGTVTLTGVETIGSGGDSGNLEQALKLDTAQIVNVDPTAAISTQTLGATPVNGSITINGVNGSATVAYTTGQSLNTIVANINAQSGTTGTTASIVNNKLVLTGVASVADAAGGNLVEALGLTGTVVGNSLTGAALNSITSSSNIGGLNPTELLSQSDNAGFATAVTNGTFTINGVKFTVNTATQSLSDIITAINSSAAGVTATYNAQSSSLQLTSNTPGPQSILLGAGSDTSNFLTASGLASGTTTAGTQASLTFTNLQGVQQTVYSATNDFTTAIQGIDLKVATSGTGSPGSPLYTVTVASDPTQAEAAINKFITAYNAAIVELNKDTVAPTVSAGTDATTGTSTSSSSGGGVLYGNYQISSLKDELVNLVSGFIPNGSNAYNSLQSVGILLDTNSQEVGADSDDSTDSTTKDTTSNSTANNSFTVNATSGQLQALDTTTFATAYAANTSAVQSLFTLSPQLTSQQAGAAPVAGATYGFSYLMGSTLANIDGLATFLTGSVVAPDNLANVLLTSITDSNNQQIDSLQQQISIVNQEATQQADMLRAQFTASETQIAELQALQSQIAAIGH